MQHIIEYIGGTGVKTTDSVTIRSRWTNPRPGDPVDFSAMKGEYPFKSPFGTVDQVGKVRPGWVDEDEVHLCCEPGSIFLGEDYVGISGGPFACVKRTRLEPAHSLHTQYMWNWGDNCPGANQGVYYRIDRPLFRLVPVLKQEDTP